MYLLFKKIVLTKLYVGVLSVRLLRQPHLRETDAATFILPFGSHLRPVPAVLSVQRTPMDLVQLTATARLCPYHHLQHLLNCLL